MRPLLPRKAPRFREEVLLGQRDQLGVRPVPRAAEDFEAGRWSILALTPTQPAEDHHLLARVAADARPVRAGYQRQRERIDPGPHEEIAAIEPRRLELDDRLAGLG
ncbi:MAG: hypothetical protein M3435_02165, partial [Actinomycetota bacterium]|nr:hypothetical protein [Actinomycetota bacterium]